MVKEVGESIKPVGGNMKQINRSGETNKNNEAHKHKQ
jgi:hypothetical protein